MSTPPTASTDTIDAAAAQWLARRDRGLTPVEQDEYLIWLRADERHSNAITRHAAVLERMMGLGAWQPELSAEPNPDLFAPPARRPWRVLAPALAVAAALVVGLFVWRSAPAPQVAQKSYLRVNERQALTDGSIVELKDGSRIEVRFTPDERRVRLTGEAHFTVAKNPARPFIVEAGVVEVHAVGTAFNVRLDDAAVEVLVTEGKVRVDELSRPLAALGAAPVGVEPELFLTAGQQASVPLVATATAPIVAAVSPEQVRTALEWQKPRLQFLETPLADAVAEFNRHNRHPLVIADARLGAVPIGGTFRVDNVEGFVRLLELTVDVRSEIRADGAILLARAH